MQDEEDGATEDSEDEDVDDFNLDDLSDESDVNEDVLRRSISFDTSEELSRRDDFSINGFEYHSLGGLTTVLLNVTLICSVYRSCFIVSAAPESV